MLRLKKKIASSSTSRCDAEQSFLNTVVTYDNTSLIPAGVSDVLNFAPTNHNRGGAPWKRKVSSSSLESVDAVLTRKKHRVNDEAPIYPSSFQTSGQRSLALPGDPDHLNPLHCFVRRNIQLFLASQNDINAPAPGRKKDIFLNQIGIRCIHCMHLPTQDRVKRAVCYPSGISRIYHCVSDMKIDHFTKCPEMPRDLKEEFQLLKETCCKKAKSVPGNKKSLNAIGAASTARYYVESAKALGIAQNQFGLFLDIKRPEPIVKQTASPSYGYKPVSPSLSSVDSSVTMNGTEITKDLETNFKEHDSEGHGIFFVSEETCFRNEHPAQNGGFSPRKFTDSAAPHQASIVPQAAYPLSSKPTEKSESIFAHYPQTVPPPEFISGAPLINSYSGLQLSLSNIRKPQCIVLGTDSKAGHQDVEESPVNASRCLLAMPEDPLVLNGLHCFVRKNIEVFSSSKSDLSIPAPGRKSRVKIGQVGIRCIHCCDLQYKDRVKRAVCYPPSVSGIYHCVSNMKFDHFESCRGFPEESKRQLLDLKVSCNRKGGSQTANCTAKYYVDAANKLGLRDTPDGIRFCSSGSDQVRSQEAQVGVVCDTSRNHQDSVVSADGLSVLLLAVNQAKKAQGDAERPIISCPLSPKKMSQHIVGETRVSVPFVLRTMQLNL